MNVQECPILADVFRDIQAAAPEIIDYAKAMVCIGHIFYEWSVANAKGGHVDTTEGYVQDESSRMYWRRVYYHLAELEEE